MWIEQVQRASAQFENLNGRLRSCLGPALDPTPCSLARPTILLYSHSAKRRMERNWGSHHGNASLRAADSLVTIVNLSFTPTESHHYQFTETHISFSSSVWMTLLLLAMVISCLLHATRKGVVLVAATLSLRRV